MYCPTITDTNKRQTDGVEKNSSQHSIQSDSRGNRISQRQYTAKHTYETNMCQQGWSKLRLSSPPQWQNQRTQSGHCPLQSLHRRQFLSPSRKKGPAGTIEVNTRVQISCSVGALFYLVKTHNISVCGVACPPELVQDRWRI